MTVTACYNSYIDATLRAHNNGCIELSIQPVTVALKRFEYWDIRWVYGFL
jgi:hypothetical protein